MNELDFSAFLVSRVCHDLVSPLGAVVNGLEVLEDERDPAMRADALKIVASSAAQALARLQFMRIAFGAAGSAGAELDLGEVGRLVSGLFSGQQDHAGLGCRAYPLAQGLGEASDEFRIAGRGLSAARRHGQGDDQRAIRRPRRSRSRASGSHARVLEEVEKAVRGEVNSGPDARGVQPFLTHKLARELNAGLTLTAGEGFVDIAAG